MRNVTLRKCLYVMVVLAAIYVGSYFAMVEKGEILINPAAAVAEAFRAQAEANGARSPWPEYRLRQEWVYSVYAPIHEIDRKLRPGFWSPSTLD